ncbi:hypothetical protein KFE80_10095 [bacterium SCSIO 12696]|nr:hypothetical protein KFE80_10095 [bacterium SCSIO 12696]
MKTLITCAALAAVITVPAMARDLLGHNDKPSAVKSAAAHQLLIRERNKVELVSANPDAQR